MALAPLKFGFSPHVTPCFCCHPLKSSISRSDMALYRILHRHEVSQNAAPAFDVKFTTESSDTSPSYKLVTGSSPSLSLWRATPKFIEEASLSALSMKFTEMARVDDAHGKRERRTGRQRRGLDAAKMDDAALQAAVEGMLA